ncbi:hypothetical protein DAPPUDRAFT_264177 [Daphnia pulex]|uniref:Uncharacterized protein n=1 Tax=Daphnia pulex TaxID=6669 RepID=E9HR14_DAPPU|nr:hypothetical protein DAPPUDRAFT_264177 [Daphnia pulex]|eukprot:EFX65822.1 hypothetical protein DAPPUDRAFT_264177 [Daphnia pulex]
MKSRQERRRRRDYVEYLNHLYDSTLESSDGDEEAVESVAVELQSAESVEIAEIDSTVAAVESDICISSEEDPEDSSSVSSLEDSTVSSLEDRTVSSLEDSTETASVDDDRCPETVDGVPVCDDQHPLAADLRGWKTKFHVPHIQVGELLGILRKHHPEFPKSTKTTRSLFLLVFTMTNLNPNFPTCPLRLKTRLCLKLFHVTDKAMS